MKHLLTFEEFINQFQNQTAYDDLRDVVKSVYGATMNDIESDRLTIQGYINDYKKNNEDKPYLGRTSGADKTVEKDIEGRLSNHRSDESNPRDLNYFKHILSHQNSNYINALEDYYIKLFADDLSNTAEDDRGNVADDAQSYHLYLAGKNNF